MYFSIHLFFLQNILSICAVSVCDRTFKRPRLDESNLYDSSSCASDESCHTWQGYETAWVQDSGDNWSPSSASESESDGDATDVVYEVEYEIETDSSTDLDDEESGSSDIEAALIPIIAAELEEESLTDVESSDDGIIRNSPIPTRSLEDKWKCLRCGVHNIPPMRYCHKCYEIRKGWLDPRPKRRRAKRPRCENSSSENPTGSSISSVSSSAQGREESIISSQTSIDSGVLSQSSSYEEDQHLTDCSGNIKQPCGCSELCGLCGLRPVDGAFMHGNTGHQLYCYSCSKRLWRERKKCPLCRRTIARVVKMFRVNS